MANRLTIADYVNFSCRIISTTISNGIWQPVILDALSNASFALSADIDIRSILPFIMGSRNANSYRYILSTFTVIPLLGQTSCHITRLCSPHISVWTYIARYPFVFSRNEAFGTRCVCRHHTPLAVVPFPRPRSRHCNYVIGWSQGKIQENSEFL